jgi:lipopolysaccharide biosynthesis glycosyltransferase
MAETVPIFVGFDTRESVAYHVFCQSVIDHATIPVAFHPLSIHALRGEYVETHDDGSNAFIYSRFLVPYLMNYKGWAIFVDGDMVCIEDIQKLWSLRDDKYAAMVIKHNYKTKHKEKYIGTSMQTVNADYPRKNWSSVILWNCGHPSNAMMTPRYVMDANGTMLHRFQHLKDEEVGELPKAWNWLSQESGANADANLIHYTLGVPGIDHYAQCEQAGHWHDALVRVNHVEV